MLEQGAASGTHDGDLRVIGETWDTLQPFLAVDKCVGCECLQAALTELLMALEALPVSPEQERLLTAVRGGLELLNLHGCLGCEPCEPADALVAFYRARDDAGRTAGTCGCGTSCADRTLMPGEPGAATG